MRWTRRKRQVVQTDEPYVRVFFAWLPVPCGEEWVWLEDVLERGTWQPMYDMSSGAAWMERRPKSLEPLDTRPSASEEEPAP